LTLARKLAGIGAVFLGVALLSVGLSIWVTWQIAGAGAAINEVGRVRMLSYKMALHLRDHQERSRPDASADVRQRLTAIQARLSLLNRSSTERPLAVPRSEDVRLQVLAVEARWSELRDGVLAQLAAPQPVARLDVEPFVQEVDALVSLIEHRLEGRTRMLYTFQMLMMALAVVSALIILYAGHVVILEPVARLRAALGLVEQGDFSARVKPGAADELGELAEGFNRMTEQLALSYGSLEAKVAEKTRRLRDEQTRLRALYDVSTFVASAEDLQSLGAGFARQMRGIARADAVAIRWSDEANDRYMLLASDSLPRILAEEEQCILTGDCFCGTRPEGGVLPRTRVIPIASEPVATSNGLEERVKRRCEQEGYATLVAIPLNLQHRLLGEVELFYRSDVTLSEEDRELFTALASHLAGAMESLRMVALDRESAVASERKLLAQELHDSIAQSLAFLKIQMGLLRSAMARGDQAAIDTVMGELDEGVRESYSDVRELLLHFRVRTDSGRLDLALRETLSKFELQAGLRGHLTYEDDGVPLPADVQIQVLHIVQEALSNVRKHAGATDVQVRVQARPKWQIRVRDNGCGFDPEASPPDATHVGLSIMRERATMIGAQLDIRSDSQGTELTLTMS
jgi:two-component system nitrate/nitrite sensor histidine kinase NarX